MESITECPSCGVQLLADGQVDALDGDSTDHFVGCRLARGEGIEPGTTIRHMAAGQTRRVIEVGRHADGSLLWAEVENREDDEFYASREIIRADCIAVWTVVE